MPEPGAKAQADRDRIDLLYRLTSSFNSSLDLEVVLNRVIDEIITATHAERGFVMLGEPGGEFTFRAARGLDQQTLLDPQSMVSLSVVRKVITEGRPILTSNAMDDKRFNQLSSIINLGLRSILCVPLTVKDQTFGVVYVDNPQKTGNFKAGDLELLSAIASNAAIAIENARLYRLAVEKGRMERELQITHQMQVGLLPKVIPQPEGWQFSAYWQPARQVAGDYYDFIPIDADHLCLVIADVADKGLPASFFMAVSRTILRTCIRQDNTPCQNISLANHLICAESTHGYFITMFFALLDLRSGALTYVNAGHPPPLLFSQSREVQQLTLTGIPLGIDDTWNYNQGEVTLSPGSMLFCYTDGVTEAMDVRQELYGFERLQKVVSAAIANGNEVVVSAIRQSVAAWAGGTEQSDDITLLLAHRI